MKDQPIRVKLTHSQPKKARLDYYCEITAHYPDGKQIIAEAQGQTEEAVLSVSKHFCLVPDMVDAIESFLALDRDTKLDKYQEVIEKMEVLKEKLNG